LRFTTVAVIGSGWLLSSNEILPMLGTLERISRSAMSPFLATSASKEHVGSKAVIAALEGRSTDTYELCEKLTDIGLKGRSTRRDWLRVPYQ
jgi:hypothetical protein